MVNRKIRSAWDYPVTLEPDDNGTIIVTIPDIPGVNTFGEDENDALGHALGALRSMISAMIDDGIAVPSPSRPVGRQRTVALPALEATKVSIFNEMLRQGVSKASLARRLGQDPKQVARLLDVLHASRHDQLDRALAALGKRIEIVVRDAA